MPVIANSGGSGEDSQGGYTFFTDNSTAANADTQRHVSIQVATTVVRLDLAVMQRPPTLSSPMRAGMVTRATPPVTRFFWATPRQRILFITCAGGTGGGPATLDFYQTSSAANATLIANGGSNGSDGGTIRFWDTADGGTARVELYGNGTLDVSAVTDGLVSIGSLEGDGIVLLGTPLLYVGDNNLDTRVFSGVIQGDGWLSKVGGGTLTITRANTYTGGTAINEGFLRVDNRTGSATGSGPVVIYYGTLGGSGVVTGKVSVQGGGTLAPGTGGTTFTVKKSLSIGGKFLWAVRTTTRKADKVIADGVDICDICGGGGFTGNPIGTSTLPLGTALTVIENTSSSPIVGNFANLADGSTVTIGNNTFQANYEGGDGNDLTLTVVP